MDNHAGKSASHGTPRPRNQCLHGQPCRCHSRTSIAADKLSTLSSMAYRVPVCHAWGASCSPGSVRCTTDRTSHPLPLR
jgi:hypothetical protein